MEFKFASFLIVLSFHELISSSTGSGEKLPATQCRFYHYYDALESALINSTQNLYYMQQMFFQVEHSLTGSAVWDKVGFRLCLDSSTSPNHSVSLNQLSALPETSTFTNYCWYYTWSSSLFYGLVTPGEFDNLGKLIHEMVMKDWTSTARRVLDKHTLRLRYNHPLSCDIHNEEALQTALNWLASWVKAYAKARGRPQTWSKEDQGYVTKWYNYWMIDGLDDQNGPHLLRVTLLFAFVILNITSFFIVARCTPHYYGTLLTACRNGRKSTYVAIFMVATLFNSLLLWNLGSYAVELQQYSNCSTIRINIQDYCRSVAYKDHVAFLSINVTLIPVLLLLELLVAACTPKERNFLNEVSVLCYRRRCSKTGSSILQTLALWSILACFRTLTQSVISITLMVFYTPARTISACAVLATVSLSMILSVAHILEFFGCSSHRGTTPWKDKCLQLFATLSLLTLTNVFLGIYIGLLRGVGEGFQGLALSLIPSTILSVVVWYMKTRLFSSRKDVGRSTPRQGQISQQTDSVDDSNQATSVV